TRGFFHIVVGIFIAVFCFMADPPSTRHGNLFDAVRVEFSERMKIFMLGFEKVLGAQVLISFINTGMTAIFLLVISTPYIHFLTLATFILGVIPIVGTVLSNTIIVGT